MKDITVKELQSICKQKGLKGYSYLNKEGLINLLEQNGGQRFQTPKRVFKKLNKESKKSYISVYKQIKTKMTVMDFLKKNKIKNKVEVILILEDNVYNFSLKEFLELKEKNKKDFFITMIQLTKKNFFRIYAK